jgi:hypothetical protein
MVFQHSCQRCGRDGNQRVSVSRLHHWLPRRASRLDPRSRKEIEGGLKMYTYHILPDGRRTRLDAGATIVTLPV